MQIQSIKPYPTRFGQDIKIGNSTAKTETTLPTQTGNPLTNFWQNLKAGMQDKTVRPPEEETKYTDTIDRSEFR